MYLSSQNLFLWWDEADDIEVDWDDGPGFDSISPDNINKMKVHIKSKYIIQAK
jgi:hypothetical protein